MDRAGWHYPSGELRVSDADRDQALSELRAALQVGRITADEFDERARDALKARTGTELTALLADLPVERPAVPAVLPQQPDHHLATRIAIGACAFGAAGFAVAAAGSGLVQAFSLQQLEFLREQANSPAFNVPYTTPGGLPGPPAFPPSPGFDWAGVITPGLIAALLAVLAICLSVRLSRARRA